MINDVHRLTAEAHALLDRLALHARDEAEGNAQQIAKKARESQEVDYVQSDPWEGDF